MTREEAIERFENVKANALEALQWQDKILTQIEDIVLKEHGERREE